MIVVRRDTEGLLESSTEIVRAQAHQACQCGERDRPGEMFLDVFGDEALLAPMSLEAFKASGILRILTPGQAIDLLNNMLSKAPVEHFMMMLPPGLPTAKFKDYAGVFAQEVMPAFR